MNPVLTAIPVAVISIRVGVLLFRLLRKTSPPETVVISDLESAMAPYLSRLEERKLAIMIVSTKRNHDEQSYAYLTLSKHKSEYHLILKDSTSEIAPRLSEIQRLFDKAEVRVTLERTEPHLLTFKGRDLHRKFSRVARPILIRIYGAPADGQVRIQGPA